MGCAVVREYRRVDSRIAGSTRGLFPSLPTKAVSGSGLIPGDDIPVPTSTH